MEKVEYVIRLESIKTKLKKDRGIFKPISELIKRKLLVKDKNMKNIYANHLDGRTQSMAFLLKLEELYRVTKFE